MTTGPASNSNAYGTTPTVQNDGAVLTDDEAGFSVVAPVFTPDGSGNITAAAISNTAPNAVAMPVLNAILIEMRIANELALIGLGTLAPDLRAMRANMAFDLIPATGRA